MLLALALFCGTAWGAEPKPLFVNDDVLQIRLEGPFSDLIRKAKRSTEPYPGVLVYEAESHAITLAARGNSRRTRGFCKFPPIRIKFAAKPEKTSLFKGQKNLKLVTHCGSGRETQDAMLEFSAYRVLNVLTPESLHVRMAEIDYVDTRSGKSIARQYGFFIEDTDDAAERIGQKEIDLPDIGVRQLSPEAAARTALFQYMIGNVDWSMSKGQDGADCCHNIKLIGTTKTTKQNLTPVPYDFDHAGLVDARYATLPDNLKGSSVRKRFYRGYCIHNTATTLEARNILMKQSEIMAVLDQVQPMAEDRKSKARKYLAEFFDVLSDEKRFNARIIRQCE